MRQWVVPQYGCNQRAGPLRRTSRRWCAEVYRHQVLCTQRERPAPAHLSESVCCSGGRTGSCACRGGFLRAYSGSAAHLSKMVRTRSWRLTAEMSGGRWNSAPRSEPSARATWADPPGGLECRRAMHTYSLPAQRANGRVTFSQPPGADEGEVDASSGASGRSSVVCQSPLDTNPCPFPPLACAMPAHAVCAPPCCNPNLAPHPGHFVWCAPTRSGLPL